VLVQQDELLSRDAVYASEYLCSLLHNKPNQLLRYSEAMPWQKGQSGNPGGLSKGSRRKLTDAFLRALALDWEAHGEAVIQRVREDNPVAYFKGLVSLVPKDHKIDAAVEQTVKVEGLQATRQFLEDIRARSSTYARKNPKPH
jgi:hypothetical protein